MFNFKLSGQWYSSEILQITRRCFAWHPWQMILAIVWIIALQITSLVPVWLIGKITDAMVTSEPSFTLLINYFMAFLSTTLLIFFISPACNKYLRHLCETTISRLAQSWITQILYQDIRLFQASTAGDLVNATKRGINAHREILHMSLSLAAPMLLKVIIIISWLAYLGSLAMLPIILLCSGCACGVGWQLIGWRRKYINQLNNLEDECYDSLVEVFMGAKSIKIARAETTATSRLHTNYLQYQQQASKIAWVSGILDSTQSAAFYLTVGCVLATGLLFTHQDFAMAELVIIFLLTFHLIETIASFLNSIRSYDEHRLDAQVLTQLLQQPSHRASALPQEVMIKHDDLHFKSFSLPLSPVLTDHPNPSCSLVNPTPFSIPFGSHVAIIGESGQGKTTFLEAVFGFRSMPEQTIFLGKHDLTHLTHPQRRQAIYLLPHQSDFLSGNLQRSILLNHPSWSHNNLNQWIQHLELYELIAAAKLPDWNPEHLSDGEKKRLAVLRCLQWNAQIILADEPTASLNQALKLKTWEVLFQAFQHKTLICITHDLSQLHRFDSIIKLKDHTLNLVKHQPYRDNNGCSRSRAQ